LGAGDREPRLRDVTLRELDPLRAAERLRRPERGERVLEALPVLDCLVALVERGQGRRLDRVGAVTQTPGFRP
jgi:hypothetical protein